MPNKLKILNFFFYSSILFIGFYFSFLKGYGSDGDTPGLIETYITFVQDGIY